MEVTYLLATGAHRSRDFCVEDKYEVVSVDRLILRKGGRVR